MPAYPYLKAELDKPAEELGNTIRSGFDCVLWNSNPSPDELAELAMYYMRKCDHEYEKYREKQGKDLRFENSGLYTAYLKHIVSGMKSRGMNIDYVDSAGKPLIDLALEIGQEACSRVLPGIYWDRMISTSLARIVDSMESNYRILMQHGKDEKELYDNLPEKVKRTRYGQKLLEISKNGYSGLKMSIDELKKDLDGITLLR